MASTKKQKRGAKASRSAFRPAAKKTTRAVKKTAPKRKAPKQTAAKKTTKAATPPPHVPASGTTTLGMITVPSGTLAIFDIGVFGFLPRDALDPSIVTAPVPRDRELPVIATRVGRGRFNNCWDHVAVVIAPGEVHISRKLGEAGVDFARLVCMDLGALDHWVHEDSLDGRADFVFWGRDAPHLARSMNAKRFAEGYGWVDLTVEQAEAKADEAARRKAANKWLLATDLRPHSHHFRALAAARSSATGAATLELAGTQMVFFFTSWGDGVFPIFLDLDADEHPLRVRVQLATAESNAALAAVNR